MKTPAEQTWLVRLAEGLDSLAAWAQEKGAWRWVGCGVGVMLVVYWWRSVGAILDGSNTEAQDGGAATIGHGLITFSLLGAGALFIAPMLVPLAARPFCWLIDAVYLGGSAIERPPLTYIVADRRMQEGRYKDAAMEFERLASWHPREVRPYLDGIRAARLAGDEKTANRLFRRGRLRCPGALGQLRASLETPTAVLSARPWLSQTGV